MLRRPLLCLAALMTALVVLTGCSPSSGSGFTYSNATTLGQVIPAKDRKQAEDITGQQLSGGSLTLASYKGKVVVLSFWASWCDPCTVEIPQVNELYKSDRASGVQVIGVNTKDERSKAEQFVQQNSIVFPNIYDQQGQVMLQLGNLPSAALPLTVVLDKQQRVAAVYVSRLSPADLQPVLTKLLAEN